MSLRGSLGQYLNLKGIKNALSLVTRPELLVPHLHVASVEEIDWPLLKKQGYRHVVFDKDNTLTLPYVNKIHSSVEKSFNHCVELFGASNVVLFSNSAGSKDDVHVRTHQCV